MLARFMSVAVVLVATTTLLGFNLANAQTNAQRDAVVGGVAGAIIGGIAGHQNDETPEGIAIGGVAGAIAGHVLGKAKDNSIQEQHQYQLQQAAQLKRAISVEDAIAMSNNGVSTQLILNQIRSSGVQQQIGVSEIITLHQNGVSESVINEMQQASIGGPAGPEIAAKQSAVVVQPPVVVKPAPVVVARPRPTIVFEQHGNIYRKPRGYHPVHGNNVYHGPRRSAYQRNTYRR